MKITWYGTASISLDSDNNGILIDPFFPLRGSKVKCDYNRYNEYENILITHPHYDHLSSVPSLIDVKPRNIYGTNQCRINLDKVGDYGRYVKIINYNDVFSIDDFKITVHKSKHIKYDSWLLFKTFLPHRIIKNIYNVNKFIKGTKTYKLNDEIVGYLVEAENKRIYIIGSLGYDLNTKYPEEVDLLILPYQGASKLCEKAIELLDIIKPKAVLLDHYDDTFPFLSRTVKLDDIKNILEDRNIITYAIREGESFSI